MQLEALRTVLGFCLLSACVWGQDLENDDKNYICDGCMEVEVLMVAGIIIADVFITLGVLLLVYYWSKARKAKAKAAGRGVSAGGRTRGANKERPPPVPNPDYEPIRKGQRDLYAGLNQRAI
ncbi:T-cell surface glycoprotein CD3 epsilon chain isoform 2-T2 [Sarcophilus harrisii]